MSKRAHIGLKTKLCSALCQIVRFDEQDKRLVRIISHDEAKTITEDQILSRFDWHHDPIQKAHDGPDVHWNLEPMLIAPHRKKTAEVDVPGIAKRKRVATGHVEHTRTMQTPRDQRPPKQSRWGSRPFPKKEKTR